MVSCRALNPTARKAKSNDPNAGGSAAGSDRPAVVHGWLRSRLGAVLLDGGIPLLAIVAFAILSRGLYLGEFYLSNPLATDLISDAKLYHQWAESIANGDWLGAPQPFHHPPLYPYLLGLIYSVLGSTPAWMVALQSLCGVANLILFYVLARRVAERRGAWIVTACAALYFPLPFYETRLLAESLTTFASALGLIWLTAQRRSAGDYLIAGILLGVACALRPNELLAVALLFAVIGVIRSSERKFALPALLLGVALPIAPFFLRNWIHAGEPVVLCDTGGINLLLAWNDSAGISFKTSDPALGDVERQPEIARRMAREGDSALPSHSEASARLRNRALRYIFEHPLDSCALAMRRLAASFSNFEYCIVYPPSAERPIQSMSWLFPLPFAILGALFLAGLSRLRRISAARNEGESWLFLAFVVAQLATMVAFFVYSRFRIVALPALLPIAALGVDALLKRQKLATGLAVLGLALGFLPPTREATDQEINQRVTLASAFRLRNDFESASQQLERIGDDPGISVRATLERFELARTFENASAAVAVLEQGLARSPEQPLYLERLAYYYALQAAPPRLPDAIALARRAVAAAPALREPHRTLGIALRIARNGPELQKAMEQAVAAIGPDAELLALYGAGLALNGDPERAATVLERAVEIDPKERKAWAELVEVYAALGRRDDLIRARLELQRLR